MKHFAWLLLLIGVAATALADGGRVRMQQASSEFIVTLFTAPEPLTTGDADFSVLVQDRASQQVLLDASVELQLTGPSGEAQVITLTRGQASNKLLQAAAVHLSSTGNWTAKVKVGRGPEQAECSTGFVVAENHSRRVIVLVFLILPLLAIALFVVHQKQRGNEVLKSR